ncbi:uncharacterized protein N0V89_000017 [Didymosphaeria variabile]|uniref:Terpene synthase n=1 Tax=Didymosphaeria variabile TaxID=1932322 RepID=A0A9W9CEJ5_9PLEO|nr:uncharacterized protein N0V89_000017 [Didymosphaeria variabile]KAJ4359463.1 hypothetical protein N0V89_000017 [Didymosphaeria variabile]
MAQAIVVGKPQLTSFPSFGTSSSFTTTSQLRREAPFNNVTIDHQAERKALLASVRGQTIRIPDLTPLSKHWPTKTNPHIDLMRVDIREWLDATLPTGKVLSALQRSDFGLFGATWWPQADLPRLKIVTYLAVWLFTWDDEIDLNDGTLWTEFSAAQTYREQTLSYVRYTLGIDASPPLVTNRIILNFAPIGAACRKHYSLPQNKMVYEEIRFFMEMSEREQRLRLSGAIPSVDDFWHYRLGSSAVTVCIALNEFSGGDMRLPADFYTNTHVKRIIQHTNTIISATNDLLSVKKEIKREAIDSLVPIIFHHGGDIQGAVDEVVAFIGGEIGELDEAAEALFERYEGEGKDLRRMVGHFVDGCKHYVTGNLTWSLETDRYGVERVDGEIIMTL